MLSEAGGGNRAGKSLWGAKLAPPCANTGLFNCRREAPVVDVPAHLPWGWGYDVLEPQRARRALSSEGRAGWDSVGGGGPRGLVVRDGHRPEDPSFLIILNTGLEPLGS